MVVLIENLKIIIAISIAVLIFSGASFLSWLIKMSRKQLNEDHFPRDDNDKPQAFYSNRR